MGEQLIHVGEERLLRIPREVVEELGLEGHEVDVVVEAGEAKLRPARALLRIPVQLNLPTDVELFSEEDLAEWSGQVTRGHGTIRPKQHDEVSASSSPPAVVVLQLDEGETLEPFTEEELSEFLDAPLDTKFEEAEWHGS